MELETALNKRKQNKTKLGRCKLIKDLAVTLFKHPTSYTNTECTPKQVLRRSTRRVKLFDFFEVVANDAELNHTLTFSNTSVQFLERHNTSQMPKQQPGTENVKEHN